MGYQSSINQLLTTAAAGIALGNHSLDKKLASNRAVTDAMSEAGVASVQGNAANTKQDIAEGRAGVSGGTIKDNLKAIEAEKRLQKGKIVTKDDEFSIQDELNELNTPSVTNIKTFPREQAMQSFQQKGATAVQQNQDFKAFIDDLRNRKQISHSAYEQFKEATKGGTK